MEKRIGIPTQGQVITTKIFHRGTKLQYRLSLAQNPTKQEEFTHTFAPDFLVEKASTVRTNPINFETIKGVATGVNGTLQIRSEDGHTIMYQCVDFTFFKSKTSSSLSMASSGFGVAMIVAALIF